MGRLRILAALFGTLIAVVLALSILDWASLAHAVAQLSFGVLAAATTLSLLTTLLLSTRWSVLAASPNVLLGRREFRDGLISQVFNLITPAAAGADSPGRARPVHRRQDPALAAGAVRTVRRSRKTETAKGPRSEEVRRETGPDPGATRKC